MNLFICKFEKKRHEQINLDFTDSTLDSITGNINYFINRNL